MDVKIEKLTKIYPPNTYALINLNLSLNTRGKIISVMGPNGAGKTTLVRVLSTQLKPTRGVVKIAGYELLKETNKIRKMIATLPQDMRPFLYTASAREYIMTYLRVRGVGKVDAYRRCKEILNELDIPEYENVEVGKLSGGTLRKVFLSMILSVDVDLYFLDEPTTGLDPISRHKVWAYLNKVSKKENKGIILTSHYMDEINILSDEIIILNKGRLMAIGKPNTLIEEIWEKIKYKIIIKNVKAKELETIKGFMKNYKLKMHRFGDMVYLYPSDIALIEDMLRKHKIRYEVAPIGLEDVFFEVNKDVD